MALGISRIKGPTHMRVELVYIKYCIPAIIVMDYVITVESIPPLFSSCSPYPASDYRVWLAMFHRKSTLLCLHSEVAICFAVWRVHPDVVSHPAGCEGTPLRAYFSLLWFACPPVHLYRSIVTTAIATTTVIILHRGTKI